MKINEVIVKPLVTEKSSSLETQGIHVFAVHPQANKHQIAKAVEGLYQTKVAAVRVANYLGKTRRVPQSRRMSRKKNWKKAYVSLEKGESIDTGGES